MRSWLKRSWLKNIRLENNYTHNDVAQRSGISREYYTMIELGERNPSVEVAKRISKTLNFDWTIFFIKNSNEVKLKVKGEVV